MCGSKTGELILTVPDCIDSSIMHQLVRCKNCDLTFVSPRPDKIDFHKYYPADTYYAYQDSSAKGLGNKLRQKLKTYLIEWAGGYKTERHQDPISKKIGSILAKMMKNHLIGIVPSEFRGKLLDVGCGNGDLMLWYQNRGWETIGIEPSLKAVQIARSRGLKVIESSIEDANLPDNYFDAITLVQVLEHLEDPRGVLNKLYRALKPGGLLIAGVPNFLCLDRQVMGNAWIPLEVPRHLYHFTPNSLKRLFNLAQFSIQEVRKKTLYRITFSQIKQIWCQKRGLQLAWNMMYILVSPIIKLIIPRDYSSTFISVYAKKT